MGLRNSWKMKRLLRRLKDEEFPTTEDFSKLISFLDNQPLIDFLKDYGFLKAEAGREKTGYLDPQAIAFKLIVEKGKPQIIPDRNDIIETISKTTKDLSSYLIAYETSQKEMNDMQGQVVFTPEITAKLIAKIETTYQAMQTAVILRIIELSKLDSVRDFLENSTVKPFFQKYSKGGVRITELELWLEMNAMLNIIYCYTQPKCCAVKRAVLSAVSALQKTSLVIEPSETKPPTEESNGSDSSKIIHNVEIFFEPRRIIQMMMDSGASVHIPINQEVIMKAVEQADSFLGLGGQLVDYCKGKPSECQTKQQMSDSEWEYFLNDKSEGRKWQRWNAETTQGRWNVIVYYAEKNLKN